MNIYGKLSNVQMALMRRDIPKTGYNEYKKYYYHTLDDLMGPCMEECHKEGVTFFFNFRNGESFIRFHEWDSNESITSGLPFPELVKPDAKVKNKNNVIVQDTGAAVTYLKRYLLVDLFNIADVELIDSELNDVSSAENKETKKESTTSSSASKSTNSTKDSGAETVSSDFIQNIPQLVVEAESKLKSKGLDDNEITIQALKMQILKQVRNVSERREINKYFKENYGGGSK